MAKERVGMVLLVCGISLREDSANTNIQSINLHHKLTAGIRMD